MMRKKDDLVFLGKIGKGLKCSSGTVIIKIDQNIVNNKGHGLAGLQAPFQGSRFVFFYAGGMVKLLQTSNRELHGVSINQWIEGFS